jgi:hypothetical protein
MANRILSLVGYCMSIGWVGWRRKKAEEVSGDEVAMAKRTKGRTL